MRLARAYTGRDLVAVCSDQPFFSTDDWFIGATPMSAGIPAAVRDLTLGFPFNDLRAVEALLEAHPGAVAALVLEVETTVPPQPGYFAGLRRLCDQHGVLLVLDEIITGFRWHVRGAQHVHGIQPDVTTLGKGLANGSRCPPSPAGGRSCASTDRRGGVEDAVARRVCRTTCRWRAGLQPGVCHQGRVR